MQFTELLRKVTIKNNYTLGTAFLLQKYIRKYHKLIDEDE